MKNWLRHFQDKYNYDSLPKLTKFITLTIMPFACILFLYAAFHFSKLTNRNKNDYQLIKGIITDVKRNDFPTKGHEAPSFSIDMTINNKIYTLYNSYLSNDTIVSAITIGKVADLYFDNKADVYFYYKKDQNEVTALYVDNYEILSFNETSRQNRQLRNITLFFGLLFTIWFISRIYRYIKYGGLN